MHCQKCQKPLQADFKVCPFCGTQTDHKPKCSSCQKEIEANWIVCPYCGISVKGTSIEQISESQHRPTQDNQHQNSPNRHRNRKGFRGGS